MFYTPISPIHLTFEVIFNFSWTKQVQHLSLRPLHREGILPASNSISIGQKTAKSHLKKGEKFQLVHFKGIFL